MVDMLIFPAATVSFCLVHRSPAHTLMIKRQTNPECAAKCIALIKLDNRDTR